MGPRGSLRWTLMLLVVWRAGSVGDEASSYELLQSTRASLAAAEAEIASLQASRSASAPAPLSVSEANLAVDLLLRRARVSREPRAHENRTRGIFRPVERSDGFLRRVEASRPYLDAKVYLESHHRQYGGTWTKGRDQFEHLVQLGLKPHHRVLEIGCGALRAAVWIIEYLDEGRYYCLEPDAASCSVHEAAREG